MNKQIRVAVFDDNPKALEALEMLIGSYEHIELAGKFNNCNFLEQRILAGVIVLIIVAAILLVAFGIAGVNDPTP